MSSSTHSSRDDSFRNPSAGSSAPAGDPQADAPRRGWISEDWLAVLLGAVLLAIALSCALGSWRWEAGGGGDPEAAAAASEFSHPMRDYVGKPGEWRDNPLLAFNEYRAVGGAVLLVGLAAVVGGWARGRRLRHFIPGLVGIFALALLAYVLAGQEVVKNYNLEYALWALGVGLLISNTIGTPYWLRPAAMTELYIKTGLVLLGAEILVGRLVELGLPGICVAWIVTPVVLVTTFWFGQRVLKISSPSLNMVISADMSVCGVSAAIATAAACKAKKEELSAAIGMSLTFTVIMMVLMPILIQAMGLSAVLAGAWIGGTIDSTGAVAVAGEVLSEKLGPETLEVAATVKMIQNILIGMTAFGVAFYWVRFRESAVESETDSARPAVGLGEVWRRFPRFILGFVGASIVFSLLAASPSMGLLATETTAVTKGLRGWFFCLAFVSIGLDSNFAELAKQFGRGKPLLLYACGQTLNICLTLLMAWLVFEKLFPIVSAASGGG
jgi:uncharacterized integral membrane protein (TIGR00698 family)